MRTPRRIFVQTTQVAIKFIKRENLTSERHMLRVHREIRALKLLGVFI